MGQSHSYRPWQLWSDSLLQNPSSPAARINKHLRTPHRVPLVLACSGQHWVWWTSSPQPTHLLELADVGHNAVQDGAQLAPHHAQHLACSETKMRRDYKQYSKCLQLAPRPPRPAPGLPAAVQPAPCLRPHTLPASSQPAQEGPACQPPTAPTCRRRRCARRAAPLGRAPLLFLLLLGRS